MPATPQATSVWAALSVAQAVAGGIAWIDPSSFQPNVDALNLYWDSTNQRMHVKTVGDYSGTDAINIGAQADSYVANGFNIDTIGAAPGFTVSTSRGSSFAPLININGDPVGLFGAYAYLQATALAAAAYTEVGSLRFYVSGADPLTPGGRLAICLKPNGNFTSIELLNYRFSTVANQYIFGPKSGLAGTTSNTRLGIGNAGWAGLYLDYTDAGVTGNIQIDKPTGSVLFAAAAQTIILTNSLITVNSKVIATVATDDATAFACKAIPIAGSCTLKLNAAATGLTKVSWVVIGAD